MKRGAEQVTTFVSGNIRGAFTSGFNLTRELAGRSMAEDREFLGEIHTCASLVILLHSLKEPDSKIRCLVERTKLSWGIGYTYNTNCSVWNYRNVRGTAKKVEQGKLAIDGGFFISEDAGVPPKFSRILSPDQGLTLEDIEHYYSKIYSKEIFAHFSSNYNDEEAPVFGLIMEGTPPKSLPQSLRSAPLSDFKRILESHDSFYFTTHNYQYSCDCTKEKVGEYLKKLDHEKLVKMKEVPFQFISCHHCNTHYEFTDKEIDKCLTFANFLTHSKY